MMVCLLNFMLVSKRGQCVVVPFFFSRICIVEILVYKRLEAFVGLTSLYIFFPLLVNV